MNTSLNRSLNNKWSEAVPLRLRISTTRALRSIEVACCDLSNLDLERKGKKAIVIAAGADCDCSDLRETILKQVRVALKDRENVVMTRLNDETLSKLDALVEMDLFKSRSEAAAFFISEGINSRKDLFDKVMPTMEEIRKLKEGLKQSIH